MSLLLWKIKLYSLKDQSASISYFFAKGLVALSYLFAFFKFILNFESIFRDT